MEDIQTQKIMLYNDDVNSHEYFMDMFELKTTFDNLNIKVELEEYESDLY